MTRGQRIKYAREKAEINQTDLAKRVGVSKQTLYKYENDIVTNIPSDIIEKISICCKCYPGYIMGWTDNPDLPDASAEDMTKALELYEKYKEAIPQVQDAVEALLKSSRPVS